MKVYGGCKTRGPRHPLAPACGTGSDSDEGHAIDAALAHVPTSLGAVYMRREHRRQRCVASMAPMGKNTKKGKGRRRPRDPTREHTSHEAWLVSKGAITAPEVYV